MMFNMGTGRRTAPAPPRYRYRGRPNASAAARATASETPNIALAPSLALLGVPSSSRSALSTATWWDASQPLRVSLIRLLTLSTALRTPLPLKRFLSPSRSSKASRVPVEAPEGTPARAVAPQAKLTATSTVGLPRLSRISRPTTFVISVPFSLDISLHPFQISRRLPVWGKCQSSKFK